MRIAQIAPLYERVPPKFYGGTERIVSYLTEELVAQGHDVTLFASGDSITRADLVPCTKMALRLDDSVRDALPYHIMMLEAVRQRAHEFDLLHFHIDLFQFPLLRELGVPAMTTLHGRLDLPDLVPFYETFPDAPLVSISDDQRRPMPPGELDRHRASRVAGEPAAVQSGAERAVSRLPRPHLIGEATGPGDRDCHPPRHHAEDRRQDRQGRRALLERGDRAAGPRQSPGGVCR
jgi:hypothetical protein